MKNKASFFFLFGNDNLIFFFFFLLASRAVTSTTTIKKTVVHRYAQYPRGWFFIRSFLPGSTLEAPQVLTANEDKQGLHMAALDREKWHAQLWTYVGGTIVNYETQLAIDVNGKEECLFYFSKDKKKP